MPDLFTDLQRTLATAGPAAAADRLAATLRANGDYDDLFYALLLKARPAIWSVCCLNYLLTLLFAPTFRRRSVADPA